METLKFVMTAAFYPPYHLGGDANHVRYLAEALAAQGHEVRPARQQQRRECDVQRRARSNR